MGKPRARGNLGAASFDLPSLLKRLGPPPTSTGLSFSALPVPGMDNYRIGLAGDGSPALIVSSTNGAGQPPILLEHLTVLFEVACQIHYPGGETDQGNFSIALCRGDTSLQNYFLDLVKYVIELIGPSPTSRQVDTAFRSLAELFLRLSSPPRKTAQGLMGELLIIALSAEPSRLVSAWHTDPREKYDFAEETERLEVKTASGGIRRHQFALDQLTPPDKCRVVVCSMFVDTLPGGVTIADIATEISVSLEQPALVVRLQAVIAETLGTSWSSAREVGFDRRRAEGSVAFFRGEDIPSVSRDVPAAVSDVRFTSELSGATSMPAVALTESGGLFEAAIPRRWRR
jgi:hypothetical protein